MSEMENLEYNRSYNDEPVYYCASCLSLAIRNVDDEDFCDNCGSIEIKSSSIQEWEELYIEKYGHKYIE